MNAEGRGARCSTWFRADKIGRTRARKNRWMQRYEVINECHVVVHEIGHALGVALSRFVSPNGAYFDQADMQWHNGTGLVKDGEWVGEWVDMHPASGVMSNSNPVIPGDCRVYAKQKVSLRRGDGPCRVKKSRSKRARRVISGRCAS